MKTPELAREKPNETRESLLGFFDVRRFVLRDRVISAQEKGKAQGKENTDLRRLISDTEKRQSTLHRETRDMRVAELTHLDRNDLLLSSTKIREQEGMLWFQVTFPSETAERGIGLGHILPTNYQYVMVWKKGEKAPISGKRKNFRDQRSGNRPGYADESGKYIPIMTGDLFQAFENDFEFRHARLVLMGTPRTQEKVPSRDARTEKKEKRGGILDTLYNLNGNALAKAVQNLSPEDVWKIRHQYGPKGLRNFFIKRGIYDTCFDQKAIYGMAEKIVKIHPVTGNQKSDAETLTRIAWHESQGGRIFAVSPTGALGIAQMVKGNYNGRWSFNPFVPETALNHMALHLQLDYASFKNLEKAISAYNNGEGAVRRAVQVAKKAGRNQEWERYLPRREGREYRRRIQRVDLEIA